MRDALLRDLAEIEDVEVHATYDERLPAPLAAHAVTVSTCDDVWQLWKAGCREVDAVWVIAPETGDILLRLTQLVADSGKLLLGCPAAAVSLTGSKYATYQALKSADIPVVPTFRYGEWSQQQEGSWVAKADDDVGCTDSAWFTTVADLRLWMQGREQTHVIQPYQHGIPASLSLLCKEGQAWLLSCNVQNISTISGSFHYMGSLINGAAAHWNQASALAEHIAAAIPALWGYVGVDVMLHQDQLHVLEINPRLTTSYIGLREATSCNPARLVLDLIYNERFQLPPEFSRKVVEIKL